jgi:hypothetical protein
MPIIYPDLRLDYKVATHPLYISVSVIVLYDRVGGRTTRYPDQRNGWND